MPLKTSAQFIHRTKRTARDGFTLVELLVVITIIGILTAVTVSTLDGVLQSSRVSGAARTVQAAMEGARDRASHGNAPRGLRLYFQEIEGRKLVGSIAYLETTDNETAGTIEVKRTPQPSPSTDYENPNILEGDNTNWVSLYAKGLLTEESTIRIDDWWYRIETGGLSELEDVPPGSGIEEIIITPFLKNVPVISSDELASEVENGEHELTLAPVEMADEALISLPQGVFIDLSELINHTKLPTSWDYITAETEGHVDIMFSPVGTVEGALSSHGLLHLPIVELEDVTLGVRFGDPDKEGNESLLTLFTQSGQVTKPPINLDLANPFSFAERGVTE